jgi:isoleucyl-tRNA synthetase
MPEDYKKTLNLPQTDFPMRANLAKREPGFLQMWRDMDLYGKLMSQADESPLFILHDGPPYANANIHIGTAFNKILKDFIPKYKWMRGYRAPYIPGWDTHGLPIELRVLREEGATKESMDPVVLRSKCTDYARKYIDIQREEFKRLGVLGDWDNPYVTFEPEYEAAQLGAFADMVEKGFVYKGFKTVYWCIDCQTALAAAEIEYEDETSPSIYVAYPMPRVADRFEGLSGKDVSVIIWTTTPWTLPASMAVALQVDYEYVFVPAGHKIYLLAAELIPSVEKETGLVFGEPILRCRGKELEGLAAIHPFYEEREVPLVLADYVTLDSGTGCVHTAPGHGVEDFETGIRYGLEIYNPVDPTGRFLPETPLVGGLSLEEGADRVFKSLVESGRLLGRDKILHSYPHCWRCKKPIIFRATEQWFVSVSDFRQEALAAIDKVEWIPDWGKERISNMVRDRSDWCISRQRVWGVPIPAFYCEDCGELILTPDRIRLVQEKVRVNGSNTWWKATPQEMLGERAICDKCGSRHLRKETDIMDVWFDSGSSHIAVLEARPELRWPADLYLEGSDQHRGWFQTSLLNGVATRGSAPYRSVLTHGFIVDGDGRKMSKSLGNTVSPQEVIEKYGADILRLWVASTDYRNDIRISQSIIDNLVEMYRRVRNTYRYLLSNVYDFHPSTDAVKPEEMDEMDRWIMSRLQGLISRVTQGFESYEFHIPTFVVYQFCVNELSAFYLDVSKDRLYASAPGERTRQSCQTVLWKLLEILTRALAPVLSFTTEETWQAMRKIDGSLPESVFLAGWPKEDPLLSDLQLDARWDRILSIRGGFSRALEVARGKGLIGKSLEAEITVIEAPEKVQPVILSASEEDWEMICIVSAFRKKPQGNEFDLVFEDAETGMRIGIRKAGGTACPRCWRISPCPDGRDLCPRCSRVTTD